MHDEHVGDRAGRDVPPDGLEGRCIHLIGVGGSGMSGAAAMLRALGARVSGSDQISFPGLGSLVARGVRVTIGHQAKQLDPDVELVVMSAAIPESNPELAEARRRGVRVVKYAELVGMLMASRTGVAVSGTHGKSTTSALCAHLFRHAGLDPSFLIGAPADVLGGSSGIGFGPHFIVEACEFDRSFLHFMPWSAAILNVEPDHLDCFGSFDHVVEAFAQFARQVHGEGLLVCSADDRWAMEASSQGHARVETFGFSPGADWQAVNVRHDRACCTFDIQYRGARLLSTSLLLPGWHNVSNALAAVALAYEAGAEPQAMAEALPAFTGVERRLSWRGEGRGVTILDDYAHHPTEVGVTIEAVRERYRPRRTWVVFQPHQHYRTRVFMDEFADSFGLADQVIIPDVYGAREGGDRSGPDGAEVLASRIQENGGQVQYLATLEAVADHLTDHVTEGDLVLTMGAGDVWKVADALVERLCGSD